MEDSTVSGNSVTLSTTSTVPDCGSTGIGGGIRLTSTASAVVRDSTITDNTVSSTRPAGEANASSGGIDDEGSILLEDSSVSTNRVAAIVTSGDPSDNAFDDAGGMEIDGAATIKDTKFTTNSVTATDPAGFANGSPNPQGAALAVQTGQPVTISDSVISGNSLSATTTSGAAMVRGGGIFNCSSALTLRDTMVTNNAGSAIGPSGSEAQGGGIFNGDFCGVEPVLTLIDTAVTHNTLTASSGVTVQGGGLYTTAPVTLTNSVIAQNSPDQCFGC
jgi:hypothetical protein